MWPLSELEELARRHVAAGLSPVVSVITHHGRVVARTPLTARTSALDHGEVRTLRDAPRAAGGDCVLYTSVQPCVMCYGAAAIMNVNAIVFVLAAPDGIPLSSAKGLRACDERNPPLVQAGPERAFLTIFKSAHATYPRAVAAWNEERGAR